MNKNIKSTVTYNLRHDNGKTCSICLFGEDDGGLSGTGNSLARFLCRYLARVNQPATVTTYAADTEVVWSTPPPVCDVIDVYDIAREFSEIAARGIEIVINDARLPADHLIDYNYKVEFRQLSGMLTLDRVEVFVNHVNKGIYQEEIQQVDEETALELATKRLAVFCGTLKQFVRFAREMS